MFAAQVIVRRNKDRPKAADVMSQGSQIAGFRTAVVAVALAFAGLPASAQQPPAKVGVDAARIETVSQTIPVIGRLVARRAGVVAARVAGAVAEVRVEVGDRISAGQVIAVQVRDRLKWTVELRQADLEEAAAQLESARSQMNMVAQEVRRLETLRQSKSAAFPQARYEDKTLEVTMLKSRAAEAAARVAQARASLSLARIAFEEAEIRAPYAGAVTLRHTEAGAFLDAGDDVVTLVADDALEVEADVPADRVAGLAPDAEVAVHIGESLGRAAVRAVVPQENPLTRTRAVRFTLARGTDVAGLAANQSVRVDIPIGATTEALTVHKDAVLNRGGRTLVFVVAEGTANPRPVQLGDAVGGRFIVLEGLQDGELAVVRGNERLSPGQPVRH